MTTDSHRWNSDIDPTVFIDDDGTPWMAWGNGKDGSIKPIGLTVEGVSI